jgi:hypothetical protein
LYRTSEREWWGKDAELLDKLAVLKEAWSAGVAL